MTIREATSQERKQLQKEGKLPKWFTTQGWHLFKTKYANEGEDGWGGRAEVIARVAAKHAPKDGTDWEADFYEMIYKGWYSCSTPSLSNTGTKKGFNISCSGQYVSDSVDGFYTSLHEAAMLSKMGFGTSAYLGDIRPRGSKIASGGTAQGVLPVLQDFVTMASKISQGGTRRGSWAGYLPVMHGDFQECYDFIKDQPDEVNIGWCWYDKDTEAMEAKDPEMTRRWKAMMKLRAIQGKGYIFCVDKANRLAPQMYKDKGLKVQSSNLCLTGDTLIEIAQDSKGTKPVSYRLDVFCEMFSYGALSNSYVKSWNGTEYIWSKVSAAGKTGSVKELVEITGESGRTIRCTLEHQILTRNRGWVQAQFLEETDTLIEL